MNKIKPLTPDNLKEMERILNFIFRDEFTFKVTPEKDSPCGETINYFELTKYSLCFYEQVSPLNLKDIYYPYLIKYWPGNYEQPPETEEVLLTEGPVNYSNLLKCLIKTIAKIRYEDISEQIGDEKFAQALDEERNLEFI